ncbi:MAG: hypothetical protein ACUVUU_04630 [bacterium]
MSWRLWIVPSVLALMAISGVRGAKHISVPTLTYTNDQVHVGKIAKVDLIVEGVRCYGTANLLRQHLATHPGIVSLVAYGSKQRIVIEFDPSLTDANAISEAIESPVVTKRGPIRFLRITEIRS